MVSTDSSEVPEYAARLRLDGRNFIVVGAGQGIGRQTCHALAQQGAQLLCVDTVESLANEVAAEVGAIAATCDARDREQVEGAVAEAEQRFGRIDGLVDIVGVAHTLDILDAGDDELDERLGLVFRHAYLFSTIAGRRMVDTGGGTMTFVASVSGLRSSPRHAVYGAFKAALMSWVRSLAVELGPRNIRANAVAPGMVWTPRVSAILGDEGRKGTEAVTPIRRMAGPSDIAGAILYLVSDLARCVSGHTVVVDGGATAKFPYAMGED